MASIEKQLLGTDTVRALRANGVDCTICGAIGQRQGRGVSRSWGRAFMSNHFLAGRKDTEIHRVLERQLEHWVRNLDVLHSML
jgi:hypothetical protein